MSFYDRLIFLCNERNISPSSLAEILNFSRGSMTAWKNGTEPSAGKVKRIRDYFGVSTDYLINGTVNVPTAYYTADPDVEIFECIELLKNENIRHIVLALRNASRDDLNRVFGMIELLNIGTLKE